jgi:hypothetical protein
VFHHCSYSTFDLATGEKRTAANDMRRRKKILRTASVRQLIQVNIGGQTPCRRGYAAETQQHTPREGRQRTPE